MSTMTGRHAAVRWDGSRVEGGAPLWLRVALSKLPLQPNAVMRIKDTVHVFGGSGELAGVATPGDWILRRESDGDLIVQDADAMLFDWEWSEDHFRRRRQRLTALVAGTEMRLVEGLRAQAGWKPITAVAYPKLHAAMCAISHDRGTSAGHDRFHVPSGGKWLAWARVAEIALSTLSREELEALAIGDEDEQKNIVRRSKALSMSSELLHAFWSDWGDEE